MSRFFKLILAALRGEDADLTTGNLDRSIVLLAVPMVLEMSMESLFAVVDVFFVSRLGTDAIATVGLTEVVLMLFEAIFLGLAMAVTAMVSRRIGEGDREGASRSAVHAIYLLLMITIPSGIGCYFFAPQILTLMGGSASLVATGSSYASILLGFNIVLAFLFVFNAIYRGAGDAAMAMRSLWLANGINIILDPCLIFGLGPFPELGLTGAAVATTIGRGSGVVYQLYFFTSGKGRISIARRHWVWVSSIMSRLVNVSVTGAGQFFISTASWLFLVRIIAYFGSEPLAGYTICFRILIFTILPAWGMSNAAATLVGQNLGAGQPLRAETAVWRTAFFNMVFLTSISIVFYLWAPTFVEIFTEDVLTLKEGIKGLQIVCLGYIFYAYGMVVTQGFNGSGDTRTPTLLNFISFWVIQIPLAWLLAVKFGWESDGVYWAITISNSFLALLAISVFRKGEWKNTVI